MKTKLRVVPAQSVESSLDEIREASAKAGTHLVDEARAAIMARNWSAAHVWADKQKPVEIGERRRGWRG